MNNFQGEGMMGVKTFGSILTEICHKKQIKPEFKFNAQGLQHNGHNPLFECVCTVGNLMAKAVARTKKEAQHLASEEMLKECMGFSPSSPEFQTLLLGPASGSEIQVQAGGQIPLHDAQEVIEKAKDGNVIGDLKELCLNRKLPEPLFEVEDRYGLTNEPTFRVWCSVEGIKKSGVSRVKKTSKKIAAMKVIAELQLTSENETVEANSGFEIVYEAPKKVVRVEEVKTEDKNEEEDLSILSCAKKVPCEYYLDERCEDHFSHSHHSLLREAPNPGPVLKELIAATGKALEVEFAMKPMEELEKIMDFQGERGLNQFYESLIQELQLEVNIIVSEEINSDQIPKDKPDGDNNPSSAALRNPPKVENEEEDDFYDCAEFLYSDEEDEEDASKKYLPKVPSRIFNNMISIRAEFPNKMPEKRAWKKSSVIAVLGFGESKEEAIKEAQLDFITSIGVLCR